MHAYLALGVAAAAAVRGQAAVAASNYWGDYNGLGAVAPVLARRVRPDSPASRRVLMALLLRWLPRGAWEVAYEVAMVLGLWAALGTAAAVGGLGFALLLATAVPLTFRYDYWDWIPELGAAVAATSGRPELAVPWFAAAAASKETAPLMPLVWLCYGGGPAWCAALGLLVAGVMWAVWLWQRYPRFDRVMVAHNGAAAEGWLRSVGRPSLLRHDMTGTVALTAAGLAAAVHLGFPRALPWLLLLVAGWTAAVAAETRVLAPLLVPIGAALTAAP